MTDRVDLLMRERFQSLAAALTREPRPRAHQLANGRGRLVAVALTVIVAVLLSVVGAMAASSTLSRVVARGAAQGGTKSATTDGVPGHGGSAATPGPATAANGVVPPAAIATTMPSTAAGKSDQHEQPMRRWTFEQSAATVCRTGTAITGHSGQPPTVGPDAICMYAQVTRVTGGYDLEEYVCPSPTQSSGVDLHFTSQREADLGISASGDVTHTYWDWSAGQKFGPDDQTIHLPPGECLAWATLWDGDTNSGQAVATGIYQLNFDEDSFNMARVSMIEFTVS